MKKLIYLFSIAAAFGLSSCEKDSTDTTEAPNNGNNGCESSITNNTVIAGAESVTLNKYTAHIATDVNTNKDHIDIFIFKDSPANRENYLQIFLHEIPAGSKTLTWISGSSNPGDIAADEFIPLPKVADQRWYGVYSSNGFETTGNMEANVNGSKLTLSFEDIELADNFISSDVNTRENLSAKVTFNISDLQNLETGPRSIKDLIDE